MGYTNLRKKFDNLTTKGPAFYVRHKLKGVKNNSLVFGSVFRRFFKYYKIQGLKFEVGEDLFSVPLQSRFFFKVYEQEEISLLNELLKGDETILELGACIGVVSCVSNARLNDPDKHVVIEANPYLITYLEKNRTLNNCKFKILNAIVSENITETFYTYGSALAGSLVKQPERHEKGQYFEEIDIQGVNPTELETNYEITFDTLIMDVEGGEVELIRKYKDWISELDTVMLEMHPNIIKDDNKIRETIGTLENYCGLVLKKRSGQSYLYGRNE